MIPFTPGSTVSLAATTATARIALPVTAGSQVRIASLSANAATFIRFGNSTVVAALTDVPILPGTVEVFTIPPDVTHMAGITGATTAMLYVTAGDGA